MAAEWVGGLSGLCFCEETSNWTESSSWSQTKPPVKCSFPGPWSGVDQRASNEPEMTNHMILLLFSKHTSGRGCTWNRCGSNGSRLIHRVTDLIHLFIYYLCGCAGKSLLIFTCVMGEKGHNDKEQRFHRTSRGGVAVRRTTK